MTVGHCMAEDWNWYEPLSITHLLQAPRGKKIVWNRRDIFTGETKKETYKEAREYHAANSCNSTNN